MKRFVSVMLIALLLLTCFSFTTVSSNIVETTSSGTTLYVDDDGTEEYTSIQDAIDNASNGDTVFVYSGTYNEHVSIETRITLRGQDQNTTIIDGGGEDNVIFISADNVVVSDFTIQGGGDGEHNAGIYISASDNHIIQNNIINNKYHGIYFDSDEEDPGRNNISKNYISKNKYGIYSFGKNEDTIIYKNIIERNSDSGIILSESIIVKSNIISQNRDKGINCKRYCKISNNIISNNKNGLFFGFYDQWNEIHHNQITENEFGIDTSDCELGQMICVNYIYKNNFIDNSRIIYNYINWFNFNNNYWGRPCVIKYIFPFNFDLNPAKEPFDI